MAVHFSFAHPHLLSSVFQIFAIPMGVKWYLMLAFL
jgi:hypothetical protein